MELRLAAALAQKKTNFMQVFIYENNFDFKLMKMNEIEIMFIRSYSVC